MSFRNLGAGTYYVVVDGASANDKGTYGLAVSAVCNGIDQVRIVELGIGTTDYLVLRNMSDCPADVTGAKVLFNDSVAQDLTTTLPSLILQPGEQLRIQENLGASVPGAIDAGGDIAFEYDRGGTALFCKGDCSVAANVVDVDIVRRRGSFDARSAAHPSVAGVVRIPGDGHHRSEPGHQELGSRRDDRPVSVVHRRRLVHRHS